MSLTANIARLTEWADWVLALLSKGKEAQFLTSAEHKKMVDQLRTITIQRVGEAFELEID